MHLKTNYPDHPAFRHRQLGIGLVEILITVVVLAIGFLSASKMQISSMRHSQSAYFESQAYFMVGDMIDRMRANVEGVKSGAYNTLTTSASASSPGCNTAFCTPAQIAQQDIYDWSQYLHATDDAENFVPVLPSDDSTSAEGAVRRLAAGKFTITVNWADEFDSSDGTGTVRVDILTER